MPVPRLQPPPSPTPRPLPPLQQGHMSISLAEGLPPTAYSKLQQNRCSIYKGHSYSDLLFENRGSSLKGKNSLPHGANSFIFE